MANNTATPAANGNPLHKCENCRLWAWNQLSMQEDVFETYCESFDVLAASAKAGCNGCKILNHAWTLVVPDHDGDRRKTSHLSFNLKNEALYLHFFNEEVPRIVDFEVYTLPGEDVFSFDVV